jgi:hypothetical protein
MLDKSIGIIAIQITTMVSTTLLRGNFPGVFCFISPLPPRDFRIVWLNKRLQQKHWLTWQGVFKKI